MTTDVNKMKCGYNYLVEQDTCFPKIKMELRAFGGTPKMKRLKAFGGMEGVFFRVNIIFPPALYPVFPIAFSITRD